MGRISRKPLMVVSSLALATTTAVGTIAAPAQAPTIVDLTGQRSALYQSELEQNLLLRTQLGYGLIAAYGPFGCHQPGPTSLRAANSVRPGRRRAPRRPTSPPLRLCLHVPKVTPNLCQPSQAGTAGRRSVCGSGCSPRGGRSR